MRKCSSIQELKSYVEGSFTQKLNKRAKCLMEPIKYIGGRFDISRGRTLGGFIGGFATKLIQEEFSNVKVISDPNPKAREKKLVVLTIGKEEYKLKVHFSDRNIGSPNLGSPDIVLDNYGRRGFQDFIHIFINGYSASTGKVSEVGISSLSSLIKNGLVRYPLTKTCNQLQFTKEESLANLSKIPLRVEKSKSKKLLGILPNAKKIDMGIF
jgi:hypothetical protein